MKVCDICEIKLKNKDPALTIDFSPGDPVPDNLREDGATVCQPCARLAIARAIIIARKADEGVLHG